MPVWYKTTAEFTVRDEEANLYVCQWEFSPQIPVKRKSGVTGWAIVNGELARLHVCSHNPCIAKHQKSKYGHMPEPLHCRLLDEQAAGIALPASSSAAGPSLAPSLPDVALEAPVAAGPDVAVAAATGVVAEPPEVSAAVASPQVTPLAPSPPDVAIEPPVVTEPEAAVTAEAGVVAESPEVSATVAPASSPGASPFIAPSTPLAMPSIPRSNHSSPRSELSSPRSSRPSPPPRPTHRAHTEPVSAPLPWQRK